jgi:hypothetical protein
MHAPTNEDPQNTQQNKRSWIIPTSPVGGWSDWAKRRGILSYFLLSPTRGRGCSMGLHSCAARRAFFPSTNYSHHVFDVSPCRPIHSTSSNLPLPHRRAVQGHALREEPRGIGHGSNPGFLQLSSPPSTSTPPRDLQMNPSLTSYRLIGNHSTRSPARSGRLRP